MRKLRLAFSAVVIFLTLVNIQLLPAQEKKERWVYFSFDKNIPGTTYYYDSETISFPSATTVRTWLKVRSQGGEQLIETEIDCPNRMFRVVQGKKDWWRGSVSKNSYVAGDWRDIPPDSEIFLLGKRLCPLQP
jgi:hypothetical protein